MKPSENDSWSAKTTRHPKEDRQSSAVAREESPSRRSGDCAERNHHAPRTTAGATYRLEGPIAVSLASELSNRAWRTVQPSRTALRQAKLFIASPRNKLRTPSSKLPWRRPAMLILHPHFYRSRNRNNRNSLRAMQTTARELRTGRIQWWLHRPGFHRPMSY